MATNYAPLVTEWTTLTGSATVTTLAQAEAIPTNLAALNALAGGSVPTSFYVTGPQILNCVNWTEFLALTPAQQLNLLTLCLNPGPLLGGSGNTAFVVDGMILSYFTNLSGPTITALTALAKAAPWWQANGYLQAISLNDLLAAGIVSAALAHQAGLN